MIDILSLFAFWLFFGFAVAAYFSREYDIIVINLLLASACAYWAYQRFTTARSQ